MLRLAYSIAVCLALLVPLHAADLPKTLKLGAIPQYTLSDFQVAISRDGKQLAYRTGPDTIAIFDPLTHKLIREIKIEQKEIGEHLHFTADGKHLLFTSMQKVSLVDPASGKVTKSLGGKEFWNHQKFAWNNDATALISHEDSYDFGRVPKQRFWNAKGELTGDEAVVVSGVRSQAISGDGKLVATGANYHKKAKPTDEALEEYVTLWDPETRKATSRIHLGKDIRPHFLSLNRDGRFLIAATSSQDRMELWDTKATKKIAALGKIPEGLYRFTYSPDDKRVAIQTGSGFVGVYETETGKKLLEYQFGGLTWGIFGNNPAGAGFLENGNVLACYGSQNRALLKNISVKDATPEPKIQGHTSTVFHTHWSADGKTLLTIGGDKKVLRWDTATGKLLETVVAEEARPATWWQGPVAVSADGKWLVVLSVGYAKLFNLETRKEVGGLVLKDRTHYQHWKGFAFSEDGKKVYGFCEAQESNPNFQIIIHAAALCWNTENAAIVLSFLDRTTRDWQKVFDAHFGKEKLMVPQNAGKMPELQIGESIRDPWASSTNAGPLSMGNKLTLRDKSSKKVILETTLGITGQGVSLSPDGKRIALPMADKSVVILNLPATK